MLALGSDLILNFPRKKKTTQQIVLAQGSAPKFQVMPTQKGLVKWWKPPSEDNGLQAVCSSGLSSAQQSLQ